MGWLEPELPDPAPGVTGYPMENFPEEPVRKRRKADSDSRESTPAQEEMGSHLPREEIKIRLNLSLKTPITDKVRRESNMRRSVRERKELNYYEETQEALRIESPPPENTPPPKENGHEKPRKARTMNGERKRAKEKSQPPDSDRKEVVNNDYCSACGGDGRFVCCETCPKSYHFTCADPPLDENALPEGEWYCKRCSYRRKPPLPYQPSFFSDLLNHIESCNPRQFKLPQGIQHAFEGVEVGEHGQYLDEYQLPLKKPKDPEDNVKLEDPDGNVLLCFKCKKSALSGPMATCAKCNTIWHVDCIDPPVQSIPARWLCPNHAEKATNLPRRPRKPHLSESNLRRNFKNNGQIDVIDEEEERLVREIPFFSLKNTTNGISAPVPKRKAAGFHTFETKGVVYRVPAQSIKLDFIDRIHYRKSHMPLETNNHRLLVSLDEVAARPQAEKEAVRDLMYLKFQGPTVSSAIARENLLKLAEAATSSDNEIQYAAIKRLIELKGRDKLMAFLSSG